MNSLSDDQLLWEYLDNQLPADARQTLAVRLGQETALAERLRQFQALHAQLAEDALPAPLPDHFEAAVLARIPVKPKKGLVTAPSTRTLNVVLLTIGLLVTLAYGFRSGMIPGIPAQHIRLIGNETLLMSLLCLNGFLILLLIDRYFQHRRWLHEA